MPYKFACNFPKPKGTIYVANGSSEAGMTTRRLDTLALIGGIIAVLAIVGQVYLAIYNDRQSHLYGNNQAFVKMIDNPEMRADFEMLSSLSPTGTNEKNAKSGYDAVYSASKQFPNSPRIQLHAGILLKGQESTAALEQSARIDPDNALPLYLLAYQAVSQKDFSKAIKLLEEGNKRPRADRYSIPSSVAGKDINYEQLIDGANIQPEKAMSPIAKLTKGLCEYSSDLNGRGQTDKALQTLSQLRELSHKLISVEDPNSIDVLVSNAVLVIIHKYEIPILQARKDTEGLKRIEMEKTRLRYLRAGVLAYTYDSTPRFLQRITGFFSSLSLVVIGAMEAWIVLATMITWWAIRRKTCTHTTNDEPRLSEIASFFNPAGLIRFYALIFILPWLALMILVHLVINTIHNDTATTYVGLLPVISINISLMLLVVFTHRISKKARAADTDGDSKAWIKGSAKQKRETERILSWINGGAMVFLFVCSLFTTAGVKIAFDAYPWQFSRAMSGMTNEESKYMTKLVAGKVAVPEKYVQEVIKDEKEREHRQMERNKKR